MSQPVTITDAEFDEAINSDKPVLVDFWAEWCGPCRMIAPILEEIAAEHDSITIAKLNIDENPQAPGRYDVMSIPTMIVFQDGVEKKRIVGARPQGGHAAGTRRIPRLTASQPRSRATTVARAPRPACRRSAVPCTDAPVPLGRHRGTHS